MSQLKKKIIWAVCNYPEKVDNWLMQREVLRIRRVT